MCISLAVQCSSDKTKGGIVLWGNVRSSCPSSCMCRLDDSIEEGCILLDHVQQHNLHLATLGKYEFRCPHLPFPHGMSTARRALAVLGQSAVL